MRPPRLLAAALAVAALLITTPAGASGRPIERPGIEFARPGGTPLLLDAYLPAEGRDHPGVIVLHGGSWVAGSRRDVAGLARALASSGFAAFAVDYRLAPRHPYPAAVADARAAVRWVRDHAAAFEVDPRALAALGTSAGGHLAALVGVLGEGPRDRGSRVRAAVSLSGPMDLRSLASGAAAEHRAGLGRLTEAFLGCACPRRAGVASPVAHVDPSDAALLLVSGTHEVVPVDQARRMGEALARERVPHVVVEVPGGLHAAQYLGVPVPAADGPVSEAIGAFLGRWSRHARTAPLPERSDPSPLARAAGLAGLALAAILAAVAPILVERHRARRRIRLAPADAAALSRIDALGRTPARRAEISAALSRGGFRPRDEERISA